MKKTDMHHKIEHMNHLKRRPAQLLGCIDDIFFSKLTKSDVNCTGAWRPYDGQFPEETGYTNIVDPIESEKIKYINRKRQTYLDKGMYFMLSFLFRKFVEFVQIEEWGSMTRFLLIKLYQTITFYYAFLSCLHPYHHMYLDYQAVLWQYVMCNIMITIQMVYICVDIPYRMKQSLKLFISLVMTFACTIVLMFYLTEPAHLINVYVQSIVNNCLLFFSVEWLHMCVFWDDDYDSKIKRKRKIIDKLYEEVIMDYKKRSSYELNRQATEDSSFLNKFQRIWICIQECIQMIKEFLKAQVYGTIEEDPRMKLYGYLDTLRELSAEQEYLCPHCNSDFLSHHPEYIQLPKSFQPSFSGQSDTKYSEIRKMMHTIPDTCGQIYGCEDHYTYNINPDIPLPATLSIPTRLLIESQTAPDVLPNLILDPDFIESENSSDETLDAESNSGKILDTETKNESPIDGYNFYRKILNEKYGYLWENDSDKSDNDDDCIPELVENENWIPFMEFQSRINPTPFTLIKPSIKSWNMGNVLAKNVSVENNSTLLKEDGRSMVEKATFPGNKSSKIQETEILDERQVELNDIHKNDSIIEPNIDNSNERNAIEIDLTWTTGRKEAVSSEDIPYEKCTQTESDSKPLETSINGFKKANEGDGNHHILHEAVQSSDDSTSGNTEEMEIGDLKDKYKHPKVNGMPYISDSKQNQLKKFGLFGNPLPPFRGMDINKHSCGEQIKDSNVDKDAIASQEAHGGHESDLD